MKPPRLALALFGLAALLGADGPPVIRRVRVPSSKVGTLLPAGADRRGMSVEAFEALARSAAEGADRIAARSGAGLLRASHSARWEPGVLVGRTVLHVRGPAVGAAEIGLDPWSPAVLDDPGSAAHRLRTTADGRLAIVVDTPGASAPELSWELVSRPGISGAAFALALARAPIGSLTLDLPAGMSPEWAGAVWRGPAPGPSADRRVWVADGAGGAIDLWIRPTGSSGSGAASWVEGTTRVDIAEGLASWRADWVVDLAAPGPARLRVDLDPGLGVVDVAGPSVASYQLEGTSRLIVTLAPSSAGPTPITLRATATVPEVGPWEVPSARPVEAGWTGGETIVRVGPGRVVQGSADRHGRRVATPSGADELGARGGTTFVFVAEGPGPLAELTFRRPWTDASATVQGRLDIGPSSARLEAQVSWAVDRGKLIDPAIDLPAGWLPDRVQVLGLDEPTTWHAEPRPGGGCRLIVSLPPSIDDSSATRVAISATHHRSGPVDLPRLVPAGVRVADDLWSARPETGLNLRPITAEGLAWIDAEPLGNGPDAARGALAWRWTSPGGTARVERRPVPAASTSRMLTLASIDREHARCSWTYQGPIPQNRMLTLGIADSSGVEPVWKLAHKGEECPITARRLPSVEGGGADGVSYWELSLPANNLVDGRVVAEATLNWRGEGTIPLLVGPSSIDVTSLVIVAVAPGVGSSIKAEGLRGLSADEGRRRAAVDWPEPGLDGSGQLSAFADGGRRAGRIALKTCSLTPSATSGFIREARLHTEVRPGGDGEQTLSLDVLSTADAPLDIQLPAGAKLRHAATDGVGTIPRRVGERLRFDLQRGGPGPRSVVLWYGTTRRDGVRIADPPTFSIPCLALSWSLLGEPGVVGVGEGLRDADPRGIEVWPRRLLGAWPSWVGSKLPSIPNPAPRDRPWPSSSQLGELLGSWAEGGEPIVVDRLALIDAGAWPTRPLVAHQPGLTATQALSQEGLATYEPGGFTLVTSIEQAARWRAGSRVDRAAVARAASAALRDGHDASDRFSTAALWAGEVGGSTALPPVGESHRYVASGWPAGDRARVEVVATSKASRRWAGGIATLGLGLGLVRGRRRSWLVGLAAGCSMIAAAWGPERIAPWASGVTCGSLALVAFGLGRRAQVRSVAGRGSVPSSVRTPRAIAAGAGLASLMAVALAATAQEPAAAPTILALMPYVDLADLESAPRRVVLLQRDHDRLTRMAEAGDPLEAPRISGVSHRLRSQPGGTLTLTTEATLDIDGPSGGSWTFPIGTGRDSEAEIDGQPVPVRILGGGVRGEVVAPRPGRHRLVLRRTFDDLQGQWRLPVNASADATLVVEAAEGVAEPEVIGARGRAGEGRIRLGPADHLMIRRGTPALAPAGRGLVLWDATPVGHLARTRWTVDDPRGLESIRVALDPGWVVKSTVAAGVVESQIRGTADRPIWVGRFDPALPAGATVGVDFWCPSAALGGPIPRFELLDVQRPSQMIGLRRRGDWQGRLRGATDADAVADDEFLAAWGPLPADALTFAGAARSTRGLTLSDRLEFAPVGRLVRPSLAMEVAAGRVEFRLVAEVADRSARGDEVVLLISPAWLLTRVDALGLTDWSRPAPNRLSLRFDGPTAPERSIRIEGWQPVATRPLSAGASAESIEVPWPSWPSAVEQPGDLAITAPASASARLAIGTGVTFLGESSGPSAAPTRRYRVESRGGLGPLRWSADPRRTTVAVRSELTIAPDSAEWRASARYQVAGGGCDTIALTLPRAWAEQARLDMPGGGFRQPTAEVVGDLATWTIRLDAPFWGSRTVVIRSILPLPRTGLVEFPRLSPLGDGTVDIDIALSGQTGAARPISTTSGLVPILDDRFPAPPDAPADRKTYHVQRPGWSLSVAPTASTPDAPPVADVAYTVVIDGLGGASGRADYRLQPSASRSLAITPPAGGEVLAVLSDGVPSRPEIDPWGKVVVAVAPVSGSLVQLIWRSTTHGLPTLSQPDLPYQLAVRCPEALSPAVAGGIPSDLANTPRSAGPDLGRIREVGQLHTFSGRSGPDGGPPSIRLRPVEPTRPDRGAGFWLSIGLAALAAGVVPIAARALEGRPLWAWTGLAALPTAAWLGVEPTPLLAALGLFLAGRSVGRRAA